MHSSKRRAQPSTLSRAPYYIIPCLSSKLNIATNYEQVVSAKLMVGTATHAVTLGLIRTARQTEHI
jgi:hypothetical protein